MIIIINPKNSLLWINGIDKAWLKYYTYTVYKSNTLNRIP